MVKDLAEIRATRRDILRYGGAGALAAVAVDVSSRRVRAAHFRTSQRVTPIASPVADPQTVSFGLTETVVPIRPWQGSGPNLVTINGKLTFGGRPVIGVTLRLDDFELPSLTWSDGRYHFLYDQTELTRRTLRVVDAADAHVMGKPLSAADRHRLQSASASIDTVYLLSLDQSPCLTRGSTNVTLTGRLTFSDKTTPVPPVVRWDYVLHGTLRDPSGQPVPNAIVSLTSRDGEQTGMSNVTGPDGAYTIHFVPDRADHCRVRVGLGDDLYRSFEEMAFASDQSATMDLVVAPTVGTVTGTGNNGQLVAHELPGAEYIGTMTGLANAQGPIAADVTWPDAQGRFCITIPTVNFMGPVSFYQTRLRFTATFEQEPGGPIATAVLPTQLAANVPRGISPLTVSG